MEFRTLTPLMPHQEPPVAKLLPSRVGGLFMDMGTGKSRTLIELARVRGGKWDRFFWFCPVALKETIRQQWAEHADCPPGSIYVWGDQTTPDRIPENARVHILGIETMSASDRAVLAYRDLVTPSSFVAVDESSYIKGHRSKRTLRITHMSEHCRYRAILTGTPFTQGAVDLFAQMRFLSPRILGYASFWSFAANHLEYEERRINGRTIRTGRIVRSHNVEYLASKIAPYVYQVRKDECLDLPSKLYETRWCRMTDEQRTMYERAKDEILLYADPDGWNPTVIFNLFTVLQTIICGFWNRTDPVTKRTEFLETSHRRLDLLMSTIYEIPPQEPVIIWGKYQHCIRQIREALARDFGPESVAQFHGGIPEAERNRQLERWWLGSRFLIASQGVGGHGLTLNEAAYSIFYADSFKYSERIQAEDRNHRIGQFRRTVYLSLRCEHSIDDRIAQALERKGSALEAFQRKIDKIRGARIKSKVMDLVRQL